MRVQRWTRTSKLFTGATVAIAVLLAAVPLVFDPDVVQKLTILLYLVLLAAMWNALAGYGGLLSVGQQAFIGIRASGPGFFTRPGGTPLPAGWLPMPPARPLPGPVSFLPPPLRSAHFSFS